MLKQSGVDDSPPQQEGPTDAHASNGVSHVNGSVSCSEGDLAGDSTKCTGACPLVHGLFTLHHLMMRVGDRMTSERGLTSSRWMILGSLGKAEQPPTISELSEMALQSVQNISRMASVMEEEGLVRRTTRRGAGRAVFVELTDRGLEVVEWLRELGRRFAEPFLDGVTPEEIDSVEATLVKLIDNLAAFEQRLRETDTAGAASGASEDASHRASNHTANGTANHTTHTTPPENAS